MKKIPREKSTITEFGAHLKPEFVVDLREKFVIETNDNWWKSPRGARRSTTSSRTSACRAAGLSGQSRRGSRLCEWRSTGRHAGG